jgi:ArsR family transcriptional regulator
VADTLREEVVRLHAEVCSAVADPNRILIIYSLAEKPMNVGDLSRHLEIPQPAVSRHLKILRERGMVVANREGQTITYSLADMRIVQALDLLRGMLSDSLKDRAEMAERAHNLIEEI